MPATSPAKIPRTAIEEVLQRVIIERGYKPGTSLENLVSLQLSRFGVRRPEQQYRIGKYRVDFAWPEAWVALEADGWWHRSPEGASKDRKRDSWLRSEGWLVFRVDDQYGEDVLADQLMRVVRVVRMDLNARLKS